MKFLTLDDVDVSNKTVFLRADLNCPVENGKPQASPRMSAHAKTACALSQKGAKTVILAHQGRKGDADFISLAQHAKLLEAEINRLPGCKNKIKVNFVADVAGQKAQNAIKKLTSGQALLLENVRFLDSETEFEKTGKSELVQNLSPLCQIFVLDAFSVAHRAQASVVGFCKCPVVAGPTMARELEALSHFENPKKPTLLILGGAKPADSLPILKSWLESGKADFALCGGAMGNLMLIASGKKLGPPCEGFLQKSGSLDEIEKIRAFYSKNKGRLLIPKDVSIDENGKAKIIDANALPSRFPILDVGPKTAAEFCKKIALAGSIVLNGPMGVYERDEFSSGTRAVFEAVANSPAFSLLGGGHTLSALEKFGLAHEKFGYVSLSGKALIEYLSGKKLPGVELLQKKAK